MKRNLIIILVVIFVAVAGVLYLKMDDVIPPRESSLYKAVPLSSPVFVELSSLKAFPEKSELFTELSNLEDISWLVNAIHKTDTVIRGNKEIQNVLGRRPVIIALDFVGENVLHPLIISSLQSADELESLNNLLSRMYGVPVSSVSSRKYDGEKIFTLKGSGQKQELHYSPIEGLVVISPEALLVEKCIRQINLHSISDNKYFNRVNKSVTTDSDISWYINHERFPELCAEFMLWKNTEFVNEFDEKVKINPKRDVEQIRNYAGWTELDMRFYDKRLAINGISAADDSLNHFLSVFEGQQAVASKASRILPANTSFYSSYTFSDKNLFFNRLENYFERGNSYYNREELLRKMGKGLSSNIKNTFRVFVKNEVVAAITNVSDEIDKQTTLFILNTEGKSGMEVAFQTLINNYVSNNKIEEGSFAAAFSASNGESFTIYKFPYPSLPGIWLGDSFSFVKANYATVFEDKIVFASNDNALKQYVNDIVTEKILSNKLSYTEFKQDIENKANVNVYADVNRFYKFNKVIFSSELQKRFEANEVLFRKYDALSWQVVCEKDIFFNAINLSYENKPKSEAKPAWNYPVGANVAMKPQIVVNHKNKAAKEIIVQDENNLLHLVSHTGEKVWNAPVKIKGKILGKIHQVDYYRNGRLQYLFNTKEKLYLIDRNGRMVADFPVVFKSPATNGVNVFDYDNNRKYRYFVACENRKVYAYNHEGKPISGWEFGKTEGPVKNPIQHFRVNNKDYIVFKDNKKVYVQNRRGQTRVNSSAKFQPSENPLILNLNGTPKIVATDKAGKVYYLFFDGKFSEKKAGRFSENHFFTVEDLNGNGIPDFVFVDGKELKVTDENGKKIFSEKFDNSIRVKPNLYSFGANQKMLGITDEDENEIYLYNASGELYEGFPLEGNSEFSIGKLTSAQLELIVGTSSGDLNAYILE